MEAEGKAMRTPARLGQAESKLEQNCKRFRENSEWGAASQQWGHKKLRNQNQAPQSVSDVVLSGPSSGRDSALLDDGVF